ncbi:MAG: hypothetical protein IPQ03_13210 [Bacteroidetes bacterium]|nr:hypothetical protein [Bacteroidota bacterium]
MSFAVAGNNTNIYVVDPEQKQVWTGSLNGLRNKPLLNNCSLQIWSSFNMMISCTSSEDTVAAPTAADHITFPNLTVVDVPQVIRQ